MKRFLYLSIFMLIACNKNTSDTNNPPSDFQIEHIAIANNVATVSWTPATDPDADYVTYQIKHGNTTENAITKCYYTLTNLIPGTTYTGTIIATDGKGGQTSVEYTFSIPATNNSSNSIPENEKLTIPAKLKNYYKEVDFTKTGTELYDQLATLTIAKHTTFLSYAQRHQYLYEADKAPEKSGYVQLIYTGEMRYWKEYDGNSGYSPQTFNTEHIYPRSKITAQAASDLHHLRVCDINVNSQRANLPFTDATGTARKVGEAWYPGDQWKGDVARMILYLNLRYNEKLDATICTTGIETLLKWNAEDPISDIEINRNEVIEQAQGNRNPFVDNPYLATLIWGKYTAQNLW